MIHETSKELFAYCMDLDPACAMHAQTMLQIHGKGAEEVQLKLFQFSACTCMRYIQGQFSLVHAHACATVRVRLRGKQKANIGGSWAGCSSRAETFRVQGLGFRTVHFSEQFKGRDVSLQYR